MKKLISIKPAETRIPEGIYNNLEAVIWEEVNKSSDPDEILKPYEFPFENIKKIADSDNTEYKENIRDMAGDIWSKNDWINALIVYYILMHITNYLPVDFYKLAYVLGKLNKLDMAEELLDIYQANSPNKKITCHAMANFYYCSADIPEKAIMYFEKYLEFDDKNALTYKSLGHLYGKTEDKNAEEKQLEAFKKAYELRPDEPNIVKSLLTFYEKKHDDEQVKKLYPELLKLAPSPRHSLNYGIYLTGWGRMKEGYSYMIERYDLEKYPIGYPKETLSDYKKWNYKDDISDKILVVHYEEGYGDSIMFGRFLPILRQFVRKLILVIQPPLLNLFKQSKIITDRIEIFTDINDVLSVYGNEKFYHMPLMDMPYPLGVDTDFIPYSSAYITPIAPETYDKNLLNVGLAYSGDTNANYNGRDIELRMFYDLAEDPKIRLYSFQAGKAAEQLNDIPNDISIIDLGRHFKDFSDTANAVAGMDLIISSDNVILNLAGAMGKRTYGIFNKYPNYRWFDLSRENVVWYDSVKPFSCENENDWRSAISKAQVSLKEEFLNG